MTKKKTHTKTQHLANQDYVGLIILASIFGSFGAYIYTRRWKALGKTCIAIGVISLLLILQSIYGGMTETGFLKASEATWRIVTIVAAVDSARAIAEAKQKIDSL